MMMTHDNSEVVVKQWTKKPSMKLQKCYKRMMTDIYLFALYKCMDSRCSFATEDAENMLQHLLNHENNVNSQINPSDGNTPGWLECSYCEKISVSCNDLLQHTEEDHQSRIFQCEYCFYRSCDAYNVVVHLNQFHQFEQKSVLVCYGEVKSQAIETVLIEKSRQEFVRPLRCTEDCKIITFVMDFYIDHMKRSSTHLKKFKCQFCGVNLAILEAQQHLLLHRIGVYQCMYCHYGTNDIENIRNHMCNHHPSILACVCVRKTRNDQVLSNEQLSSIESTTTVYLGEAVDGTMYKLCPFTQKQLSFRNPSLERNSDASESDELISFSTAETISTSNCGLMLSGILNYMKFEKEIIMKRRSLETLTIAAYSSNDTQQVASTMKPVLVREKYELRPRARPSLKL